MFRKGPQKDPDPTRTFPPAKDPDADITFDPNTAEFAPTAEDEGGEEIFFEEEPPDLHVRTWSMPVPGAEDTGAELTSFEPIEGAPANPELEISLRIAVLEQQLRVRSTAHRTANDTGALFQAIGAIKTQHIETLPFPDEIEKWLDLPHIVNGKPTEKTIREFLFETDHETTHFPSQPIELSEGSIAFLVRGHIHVSTQQDSGLNPIVIIKPGHMVGEIVAVGGTATAHLTAHPDDQLNFPIILTIPLHPFQPERYEIELEALIASFAQKEKAMDLQN